MNKLGFYIENSTVVGLREAIQRVRPPVILIHAGDRGLLREIRQALSPDSFIVGRLDVTLDEQNRWLSGDNPEQAGIDFAERILAFDPGYATERVNGRLLIDAWMGLNESLSGPASFPGENISDAFRQRADRLDRFQTAMRERLLREGLEAVAFNFGAGNFTKPQHYLNWFPRTLASYKYLGFHEYGWPGLAPGPNTSTAALYYRACIEGIRQRYGDRHLAVITEAGLARMYKIQDAAGDVGWLYPADTVSEDQYWHSLSWYNDEMNKDVYVLGACLFEVGHSGKWQTFRHLGLDNQQHPLTLISRIAGLKDAPPFAQPKKVMRIEDFPRPPDDNGRGIHWSARVYHPTGSALNVWISELQAMKIKWVKLLDDGGGSSMEFCQRLLTAGIMPVVRLFKETPNPEGVSGREYETVSRLVALGVRYFETNNEPDLPAEWVNGHKPDNWLDIVIDHFIQDASQILARGGLPAMPAMGVGSLLNPAAKVVERGRTDLFEQGAWVAIHNYTLNHPLDYPDDPVNQLGLPLTQEEYDLYGDWAWDHRPLQLINQWRQADKNPGQTVAQASAGFRAYELAGKLIHDTLGFYVPIISTEGGPVVGWGDDRRYNKLVPQQQAEMQAEIVRRTQNDEVPPWYFAMCTWLIAAKLLDDWSPTWEQMAWYTDAWNQQFGLAGRLPVIDALKELPSVPRLRRIGTGVLRGQVRCDSGQPLGAIRLSLTVPAQAAPRIFTTEPGGAFTFDKLPAGTYSLAVVDANETATDVVLADGEKKSLDLTLRSAGHAALLSGQVFADDGTLLSGVTATLLAGAGDAAKPVGTTTTTRGRFTFERLAAGSYAVKVARTTSESVVVDGWSVSSVDVHLPPPPDLRYTLANANPASGSPPRIYGRVLDIDGNGINGIRLRMSWDGDTTSQFPETVTGRDPYKPAGSYEFIASPGTFRISVVQGDWPSAITRKLNTANLHGLVSGSVTWEVNFQLQPATGRQSTVRGRISNAPRDAVLLLSGGALSQGPLQGNMDADGDYQFDDLPPGDDYQLTLQGIAPLGDRFALDGKNQMVKNMSLTARIRGKVLHAPAGARVTLTRADPVAWQRNQTLGGDGAYLFDALPPGRYTVNAAGKDSPEIALGEGQQTAAADVDLGSGSGGAIRGRAQQSNGSAVTGARVVLQQAGQSLAETRTDAGGRFGFDGLAAGTYSVALPDSNLRLAVMVDGVRETEVLFTVAPGAAPVRSLQRYLLLGRPPAQTAESLLLLLRMLPSYLGTHGGATVGFNPDEAALAENVVILAGTDVVPTAVEEKLTTAGCHVERIEGDLYALADRLI